VVMTDPDRRRRWASIGLLVVILIATGVGAYFAIESAGASRAADRGNQLQSCRAEYRSIVDEAQAAAATAEAVVRKAEGDRGDLFLDGLVAAVTDADVEAIIAQVPEKKAAVVAAREDLVDAQQHVEAVTTVYADAVRLSRVNPDRFLADCRALP